MGFWKCNLYHKHGMKMGGKLEEWIVKGKRMMYNEPWLVKI